MDRLLNSPGAQDLQAEHGRDAVKHAARQTLDELRAAILRGQPVATDIDNLLDAVRRCLEMDRRRGVRRVINLSGTVLHTNLGRAPLPRAAIDAALEEGRHLDDRAAR